MKKKAALESVGAFEYSVISLMSSKDRSQNLKVLNRVRTLA